MQNDHFTNPHFQQRKMSANQLWKSSGTTLPFKAWLQRQNDDLAATGQTDRDALVKSYTAPFSTVVQTTIENIGTFGGSNDTTPTVTHESGKTLFGINKKVLAVAGIIVLASIAIGVWRHTQYSKK